MKKRKKKIKKKLVFKLKKLIREPHFLQLTTKHDMTWWVQRVQAAIAKHTKPITKGKWKGHGNTNLSRWVRDIFNEVLKTSPKEPHDENMRFAAVAGMVLICWFLRCQRAKCYDPNRPIAIRRGAMERWMKYSADLVRLIVEEQNDPKIFPGQQWDPPFSPSAKEGTFI